MSEFLLDFPVKSVLSSRDGSLEANSERVGYHPSGSHVHARNNNTSDNNGNSKNAVKRNSVAALSAANNANFITPVPLGNAKNSGNNAVLKTFHHLFIDGDEGDGEFAVCAEMIARVIRSRQAYKSLDKGELEGLILQEEHDQFMAAASEELLTYDRGVYRFKGMKTSVLPWETYVQDVKAVFMAIESGPCLSVARTRLTTIAEKTELYFLLNAEAETNFDKQVRGGGVYARCRRVDNAIFLMTSVTAHTLLEFIITTALEHPRTPLFFDEDGKVVCLMEYLESHGVTDPRELTVQGLGLHPPHYRNEFQDYDALDPNLNPAGKFGAKLLRAVLSKSGPNDGDLFGGLIRHEFEKREFKDVQTVATEIQLPLYGQNSEELRSLAAWVWRQGFNFFKHNMWTLCIMRSIPPADGSNEQPVTDISIGDQLRNIFYPMLMATLYPNDPAWADVVSLLRRTGAIGISTKSVTRSYSTNSDSLSPDEIKYADGVGDCYFFYYVWANLVTLNALRAFLGLNTFNFCPSVFEVAPAYDQLVSSFLLADVVYHVNSLEKSWIMQYLFMYCRIGVVMSPLRDNALTMSYFDHPIVRYLSQGLLVSITTSDPLYFHYTNNSLLEEYATLIKLRSLTPMNFCELARNSVLNSNFPVELKRRWLGEDFNPLTKQGNDIRRSSVCDSRLDFINECLLHEETVLNLVLSQIGKKGQDATFFCVSSSLGLTRMTDEKVQQLRSGRRSNNIDWRIVYPRVDIVGGVQIFSLADAVETLRNVISLRQKYLSFRVSDVDVKVEDVFSDSNFDESKWEYGSYYGVFLIYRVGCSPSWPVFIPPVREFIRDVATVQEAVMGRGSLCQLATHRLRILERKFLLHLSLNIYKEAGAKEEKDWNNRDFFTAHKVDTNVQTAAGMNARTLLEFFVEKALHHGHDVVFEENNQPITLRQLLERYNINPTRIAVDELNHLINTNHHIRSTFLAVDNFMKGRYFAELTKRTLKLYYEDAFTFSENRLVISGRSKDEWWKLAQWFDRYGMASLQNRWMINLPRQYRRLRQEGVVRNFGEYLDNIFQPLWEVSFYPAKDTKFHYFLTHVSGIDSIDDESKMDMPLSDVFPHDWGSDINPPYNLYMYYYWANITTLNEFRASRGLSTFTFRPQCGEKGGVDHLIGGFLLADGINHGVTLGQNPVLEYMYYITQLGVAISPLSNTAGASAYLSNPFPLFFHRGLNVSLATNEPLYFHFTREPLIEEYSIAAKLWKFEFNDLSEIARNSVLQSGFPSAWKEKALGKLYHLKSALGNDVQKSRVSDIRVAYRYEVYHAELDFLSEQLSAGWQMPRAMRQLREEIAIYEEVMNTKVVMPTLADEGDKKEVARCPAFRAARARAELEALEREAHRMKVVTTELRNRNNCILERFNCIRRKLKTESLTIMGNLAEYMTEKGVESDMKGGVDVSSDSCGLGGS